MLTIDRGVADHAPRGSTAALTIAAAGIVYGNIGTSLFLDGAYQTVGAAAPVFRPVAASESSDLQQLVEQIAGRIGRALERRSLVERELENAWLAFDGSSGNQARDADCLRQRRIRAGYGRNASCINVIINI